MKVSINLNEKCTVRLTPAGVDCLVNNNLPSYQYNFDPKTKILEEQLWIIMQTFGSSLYNGANYFETNEIVFEKLI
jgi:hypothetical protein